ncbi:MAG: hypothetical protein NE330_23965 [Lentisphaeraceae bacterium]|nr:hypothetical protein [Lentisphaeraceae bacterium]
MSEELIGCGGFCQKCKKVHSLKVGGQAKFKALELTEALDELRTINFSDPLNFKFSTDYLFGDARGQMFGVLECRDKDQNSIFLKAFSCQYNGEWLVESWCEPCLDVKSFHDAVDLVDSTIKELGKKIENESDIHKAQELKAARKKISQKHMKEIHSLYKFNNFRGESAGVFDAFVHSRGIPTGTGDCCAPKLLNYAAKQNLKPISIAEFYYGKENKSGKRQHKHFYTSCLERCEPILGFILCGVEE